MTTIRTLLTGRVPLTLAPDASALEAAHKMVEEHVGALLVVDASGKPAGIFTERDLMKRVIVAGKDPSKVTVGEVMTRELFSAEPDTEIAAVRKELQERHIRHIPVIQDGKAMAILSLRDVLRANLDECQVERDALTEYIKGPGEG